MRSQKEVFKGVIYRYEEQVKGDKGKKLLFESQLHPDTKKDFIKWRGNKYKCSADLITFMRTYEAYTVFMDSYLCNTVECHEEDKNNLEAIKKNNIEIAVSRASPDWEEEEWAGTTKTEQAWYGIMLAVYDYYKEGDTMWLSTYLIGEENPNVLKLNIEWFCDYYFKNFDASHSVYQKAKEGCGKVSTEDKPPVSTREQIHYEDSTEPQYEDTEVKYEDIVDYQNERTYQEFIESSITETQEETEIHKIVTIPKEVREGKEKIEITAERLQKLLQKSEYIRQIPSDIKILISFFDGNKKDRPEKFLLLGSGEVIDYDGSDYTAEFITGDYWMPRLEQSNDFCATAKIMSPDVIVSSDLSLLEKGKLALKYGHLKDTFGKCIPLKN